MLFALYHKVLQMSTRQNPRSFQKQCQWNTFKKMVPGYHNNQGSNIMLTNCNVIWSGGPEERTKVSGCYSNWMYRKWSCFNRKVFSASIFKCEWTPKNFFTLTKSCSITLFGWQSSETEAVSVIYCCVTNNLKNTATLNSNHLFFSWAFGMVGWVSSVYLGWT